MERNEFIKQCEVSIHQFEPLAHQAVMRNDFNTFSRLAEGWKLANENWLLAARGMNPEKARVVMTGFAMNELTKWMDEHRPGPPPSVLTLYPDDAISDQQFSAQEKNWKVLSTL